VAAALLLSEVRRNESLVIHLVNNVYIIPLMLLALVEPQLAYGQTKAHTNMGYKHGNRAVSMSYMKKKYHKMMLAAILILTAMIFCYQAAYGDTG